MAEVRINTTGLVYYTDGNKIGGPTASIVSDGNASTYVQTCTYVAFDLGSGNAMPLARLKVHSLNSYATTNYRSGTLYGSNDSTNGIDGTWTTVKALADFVTAGGGSGWYETTSFTAIGPFRWYRIAGLPSNTNTVVTDIELWGPSAAAPHRYWRLYINQTRGNYASASTLQFRTSVGGANVATPGNGSGIQSTYYNGSSMATQAFDSDGASIWASTAGLPQWVGWDFGAGNAQQIVEFSYRTSTYPEEGPRFFQMEYSDDGTNWFIAASYPEQAVWTSQETRVYSCAWSAGYRYWRIKVTANSSGGFYSVTQAAEIQLMTDVGGPDQTGAGKGTALESGHYYGSGYGPEKAFDDDPNTQWIGSPGAVGVGGFPEWIGWDFGAGNPKTIVQFSIRNRSDGAASAAPMDFDLEYSDAGSVWYTACRLRGQTFALGEQKTYNVASYQVINVYRPSTLLRKQLIPVPAGGRLGQPRLRVGPFFLGPQGYQTLLSGNGFISGTVTHDGSVASRNVYLFHRGTGTLLAKTVSAADGTYRFDGINADAVYTVLATDADVDEFNAAVADIITPATG